MGPLPEPRPLLPALGVGVEALNDLGASSIAPGRIQSYLVWQNNGELTGFGPESGSLLLAENKGRERLIPKPLGFNETEGSQLFEVSCNSRPGCSGRINLRRG